MNIVKDFLLMSLKQKTENVNWEALGTNASLLPLVYLMVMAPGLLILLGLCCLLASAVPNLLTLGGILITFSLLLIVTYRMIIKYQFKMKKLRSLEEAQSSETPKSPLDKALSPFLKQLIEEHRLFLNKAD